MIVLDVNLDIEFDSPVLVLPRSNLSPEVFVAHLGKIRMSNSATSNPEENLGSFKYDEYRKEQYYIEVSFVQ